MTEQNHLFQFLASSPSQNPFILDEAGEVKHTHGSFFEKAARIASSLQELAIQPEDRILCIAEKTINNLETYIGVLISGAIWVPSNPSLSDQELHYLIQDAEPKLILCDSHRLDHISTLAGNTLVLTLTGENSLQAHSATQHPLHPMPRKPHDLAAILYTSGTTGRPKGAMLTHSNLSTNATALIHLWRFSNEDRLIHALPIFHTHGLFVASHCVMAAGAQMYFLPRFSSEKVLSLLPKATVLMGVPTFYSRLLQEDRFEQNLASRMRLFISGSAPLQPEIHQAFETRIGQRILERYGMTEAGMIASNSYEGLREAGKVGFPLPGVELKIEAADEEGHGKIKIRGPGLCKGYWRAPEKTAEEFSPDGWFSTGDIGRLDNTGQLSITGRAKDLIISGGFNVYPIEIETRLNAIPGIMETAVFGINHPDFGEAVVAAIVLNDEVQLTSSEINAKLKDELSFYKIPKKLIFMDHLPRNAMGKIQKAQLRQDHAKTFDQNPSNPS